MKIENKSWYVKKKRREKSFNVIELKERKRETSKSEKDLN